MQALQRSGDRKRMLAFSISPTSLDVSERVVRQAIGWQTRGGQERLRDKLALKILDAAILQEDTSTTTSTTTSAGGGVESGGGELARPSVVIGVMGTSVTAGHDNYFNESWSVVLGNLLRELPVSVAS